MIPSSLIERSINMENDIVIPINNAGFALLGNPWIRGGILHLPMEVRISAFLSARLINFFNNLLLFEGLHRNYGANGNFQYVEYRLPIGDKTPNEVQNFLFGLFQDPGVIERINQILANPMIW